MGSCDIASTLHSRDGAGLPGLNTQCVQRMTRPWLWVRDGHTIQLEPMRGKKIFSGIWGKEILFFFPSEKVLLILRRPLKSKVLSELQGDGTTLGQPTLGQPSLAAHSPPEPSRFSPHTLILGEASRRPSHAEIFSRMPRLWARGPARFRKTLRGPTADPRDGVLWASGGEATMPSTFWAAPRMFSFWSSLLHTTGLLSR